MDMLGGVSRGQVVRIGEWKEDLGVLKLRVQIIYRLRGILCLLIIWGYGRKGCAVMSMMT